MRSSLILFFVLGAGFTLALGAQESPRPLNRYQLLELLVNGVPSERVAALVKERSIDFEPPDEFLEVVQVAGADEALVNILGSAAVVVPPAKNHNAAADEAVTAEQNLRDNLSEDPKNGGLHFALAWVLLNQKNKSDEAIAELQQAQTLKPSLEGTHILLGVAYSRKKQWDLASSEFHNSLRANPDNVWALAYYATFLREQGDKEGAVKVLRDASRLKPDDPDLHYQLGLRLMDVSDHDGAIAEFHKAEDLRKEWYLPHRGLGQALEAKGDNDEALVEYREGLHIKPRNSFLNWRVGFLLEKRGDRHLALEHYRKASEIAPKNAAIRKDYERLLREMGH